MRPTLTFGSSGPAVIEAQAKLNKGVSALSRLDEDGSFGPLTGSRVREFQMQKQLGVDGVVGPITWNALDALAADGVLTTPVGVPPQVVEVPAGPTAGSLRERIVQIAMAEAVAPWGKVSDRDTMVEDGKTVRVGWRQLKRYFDEGVEGWNEGKWTPAALRGIKTPGSRIPLNGVSYSPEKGDGVSWCGIFATWVLQQAGLPVKWRSFHGITPLPKIFGKSGLQVGDVAVMANKTSHHFIVAEIKGATVTSVNGNSDYQSILVKQHRLDEIAAYYRAE